MDTFQKQYLEQFEMCQDKAYNLNSDTMEPCLII